MTSTLYRPDDADQVLADFGRDLVCVAVPAVTRGLLDDAVVDTPSADGGNVSSALRVLKVKAGAFGTTKLKDTVVTLVDTGEQWTIDAPLPRVSSLFDSYALQKKRARPAT